MVHVRKYTKSDGTTVRSHQRESPDSDLPFKQSDMPDNFEKKEAKENEGFGSLMSRKEGEEDSLAERIKRKFVHLSDRQLIARMERASINTNIDDETFELDRRGVRWRWNDNNKIEVLG